MSEKKTYTVRWEIDIDADSPEDAARQVFNEFFKQDHSAQIFDVKRLDEGEYDFELIDLENLDSDSED